MARTSATASLALCICLAITLTTGCAKRAAPPQQGLQGSAPVTGQPMPAQPGAEQNAAPTTAATQDAASQAAGQGTSATGKPTSTASSGGSGFTDWPAFRGPNADGIAPGKGINKNWAQKPPKTLWQVAMSDRGYAGPSVAAGKVFIIDHQGDKDIVRALDLKTGKDLWSYPYADTSQFNYGFARSTPVYSQGKLYVQSRLGLVICLDAAKGELLWSRDLHSEFGGEQPQWDYAASPLVDGNKVIVCPGGKTGLAALDAGSGKTLWTGGSGGRPGYATPAKATLDGKGQYLIFAGSGVYGANADSGKTLWQVPWKTNFDVNAATPVPVDGWVFVTSGYNVGCGLIQVKGGSAKLHWQSKEIQSHFNTPVYYGGFLYGTSDPGNLVCLNPKDGKAMWSQSGFEKGGVAVVDGCLIAVSGNSGDVVLVSAVSAAYQELGRIKPLGGQSWSPPVIAQGKLLVRNTEALACVDLM